MLTRLMTALFALAVALTGALAVPAVAATSDNTPAYLFAFDGRDAQVAPVSGTPGSFTLTVPITPDNQLVTWFTDRPVRDAGHLPMATFAGLWEDSGNDSFTADPPNVAITVGKRTAIATMTDAAIITAADGSKSLQSTMTLVKGAALKKLAKSETFLAARARLAKGLALAGRVTLPQVSVFVDDSSGTGCSGWKGCCQAANSVPGGSCTVTKT
jgi:hypothetical protein